MAEHSIPTRPYRRIWLAELAARGTLAPDGEPWARALPFLPSTTLHFPPLAFSNAGVAVEGAQKLSYDALGAAKLERPPTSIFELHNAIVHGGYGIVTLGDYAVFDSLMHLPTHELTGAAWDDEETLRLPSQPVTALLDSAMHVMACNVHNYYHWMIDVLARFDAGQSQAFAERLGERAPVTLIPRPDRAWKRESLRLAMPATQPLAQIANTDRLVVRQMLFVPDLSSAGFNPSPHLLHNFTVMRDRVYGAAPLPKPFRRIYISRGDTRNRVLENEAEIVALAVRAGFTPVCLSTLSVERQIRLFAETSHILAPHGAGLTNIGFCQPGTVICELQMEEYIHWIFRMFSAMGGLSYGCVLGEVTARHEHTIHGHAWRVDPAALQTVLAGPLFAPDQMARAS